MRAHRLRVRDLALQHDLNISTLSRRADISPTAARNYWYGDIRQLDTDILERFAKLFGVGVGDLFESKPPTEDDVPPARRPAKGVAPGAD